MHWIRISSVAAALLVTLALTSCSSAPSRRDIENGDYGPSPDYDLAREVSENLLRTRMSEREPNKYEALPLLQVDANTAEILWESVIYKGWYDGVSHANLAWQLDANVNAKNAKGELTGFERWSFWFRYGSLVAIAEPSRMGNPGFAEELLNPIPLRKAAPTSSNDSR
jgi:hypothetical protein